MPVVVEYDGEQHKLVCPRDMTAGSLMFVLRKRIKLPASDGIFLMHQGRHAVHGAMMISQLEREDDGLLALTAVRESTFGACPCGDEGAVEMPHRDPEYGGAGRTPLCVGCLDGVLRFVAGGPVERLRRRETTGQNNQDRQGRAPRPRYPRQDSNLRTLDP